MIVCDATFYGKRKDWSGNSCRDGIDNYFDHTIDGEDRMCHKRK